MSEIKTVRARQIFDSRGVPTVECEIGTGNGVFRGSVPSGASAGIHEAHELRDGGDRFGGKAVLKAVRNVNEQIGPKLLHRDSTKQGELDDLMIELDGTENKSDLGGNAILAVSIAICRAGAAANEMRLFEYIGVLSKAPEPMLPVPQMLMVEGGAHASRSTDFQEFLVMPFGASFSQAFERGNNIYQGLRKILESRGFHTNVGKEGAFAPSLEKNSDAFDLIIAAIEKTGLEPGKDVALGMDSAGSQFFANGKYNLRTEGRELDSVDMIGYYEKLIEKYPILSIEDGLAEDDWEGWISLNQRLGGRVKIVGDDFTVTNPKRLQKAIDLRAINSIIIKPNQIGTVTETIKVVDMAKEKKFKCIVSHRGGDTNDSFIADFVVGAACGLSKFGAPARGERLAKYNQLLRIEEYLDEKGRVLFAGRSILE